MAELADEDLAEFPDEAEHDDPEHDDPEQEEDEE
jgi:hypothetical protein